MTGPTQTPKRPPARFLKSPTASRRCRTAASTSRRSTGRSCFARKARRSPAEYKPGLNLAIACGWLALQERDLCEVHAGGCRPVCLRLPATPAPTIYSLMRTAFDPCIPTRGTKVPDRLEWIHEIKHDGYRLIIQRDGRIVRLWTRNGAGDTASWPTTPASTLMHSAVCPRASERKSGGIFFRGRWATPLLLAAGMNRRVASGAATITGMSCHRH